MPEPTLISVFLRKLSLLDTPVVRRLLEMAAVLALIWLAAIAKQKEPQELGAVASLILNCAPIVVMFQFVLLLITIVASGAKEIENLTGTANALKPEKSNSDKSAKNAPHV